MTRYWLILALVLVCAAGCGGVEIPVPREMYDEAMQAQVERVLLECPESERIPLRSPMTGEPGVIFYYDQPAYIAVADVETVVDRMRRERPIYTVIGGTVGGKNKKLLRLGTNRSMWIDEAVQDCPCPLCTTLTKWWREQEEDN